MRDLSIANELSRREGLVFTQRNTNRLITSFGSTIQKVDQQRLLFITGLFTDMNFKQADAEVRARLALYYQVAEQGIFLKESKQKSNDLLKQRFDFLTTNHESLDKPGC